MRRGIAAAIVLAAPGVALADVQPIGCRSRPLIAVRDLSPESADRLRMAPTTTRRRAGEFVLRDGRVLIQGEAGEPGELYLPADFALRQRDLDDSRKARRATSNVPFHPLRGLLDDGARFESAVPALRSALTARLAREHLEATAAGIDTFAARWREARCAADGALVHEVTAWLGGELVARLQNTLVPGMQSPRWSTRAADDGTIEPIIERAFGEPLVPWAMALRLLDSPDATVASLFESAGVPPAPPRHL